MSNLRPIGFPGLVAAMVESMESIDKLRAEKGLPLGLSGPRWRVLECIADHHPKPAPFAALRLYSGLNPAALKEHLQALRWRGLVMFESNCLSPTAMATVDEYRSNIGEVQKRTNAAAPEIHGRKGHLIIDEAASFASLAPDHVADAGKLIGDPANAPACIRPDCTPFAVQPTPLSPSKTGAAGQTEEKANAAARFDSRSAPEAGSESVRATTAQRTQPKPRPVQTVVAVEAAREPQITVPVPATPPRISVGAHIPATPWRGRDAVAERTARLASAIVYLKSRAVIVDVVNRDAPIRQYRVSGKRDNKYAEEVIEIAMGMGWAE